MALEDLKRYRPAAVALNFYQEKNETAAKSTLEKLVTTLDLGKDGPVAVDAIRKSEKGDQLLANEFALKYQESLMGAKINEMFEFYSSEFREYLEGNVYNEAKKVFEKYGNENYKDILSKVIGAKELLDSKRPNITEEEKQGAKDILQEYGKITMPLQSFENLRMEALSKPMAKEALKKDLTEMFKPKKGESS